MYYEDRRQRGGTVKSTALGTEQEI